MNLEDALSGGGNNQSRGGGGVWGDSSTPAWPGAPPAGNSIWGGNQPAGGGFWSGPGPGPAPGPAPGPGFPPAPGPGFPPGPAPGGRTPVPQQNLTVPFAQNLPNGVYDKLLITIAGTIKPNADKITVDMSTPRDLAFHFNPRFNESGRQVIVRNSCIGKKWGPEERELPNFPFTRGQPFELKILCTNREYRVAVNNSHLLTYQHRVTDLRSITQLNIYYDLSLSKVLMETLP